MSSEEIDGIDYIFDRYAYLGLETDATATQIHKAIRKKRAKSHVDRLTDMDEEILKKARTITELVDRCAEILENDTLRPLYTERLLEFRRDNPNLVSKNGNIISSSKRERLDLSYLLNEKAIDFDVFKTHVEALSGYSPKHVAMARKIYAADPSEENRDFLQAALNTKLDYLTTLEETAWAHAGINYFQGSRTFIVEPEDYVTRVEDEIQQRHDALAHAVEVRNSALLLGTAKPALLLGDGNKQEAPPLGTGLSIEIRQKLTEKAQRVFLERAEIIRSTAEEKKQVLAELLTLTPIEDFGLPADPTKPYWLHLAIANPEPQVFGSFRASPDRIITMAPPDFPHTQGMTFEQIKALGLPGCFIQHNNAIIDVTLELSYAVQKHHGKFEPEPAHHNPVRSGSPSTHQP